MKDFFQVAIKSLGIVTNLRSERQTATAAGAGAPSDPRPRRRSPVISPVTDLAQAFKRALRRRAATARKIYQIVFHESDAESCRGRVYSLFETNKNTYRVKSRSERSKLLVKLLSG
ncbi:hypothetical protein EVAR_4802_1 [Eumeta japonica]|uniref:Uncharacterized protein n=1 Tax=Eumeta variegata TaxID=151549 RepID=A0A4C1T1M0_EUMVA|nr:hypothetical protein EVAR_4802_1 [Eumeta japonica]